MSRIAVPAIVISSCFLFGSAHAAPPRERIKLYDVRKFDIDGVRLYMSAADTIAALKAKFGKSTKIDVFRDRTMVKPVTPKIGMLVLDDEHYKVSVEFVDSLPPTKNAPEQVRSISLTMKNNFPDAAQNFNKVANDFLDGVISKFGKPSGYSMYGNSRWCLSDSVPSDTASPCDASSPYMTFSGSAESKSATLTLIDEPLTQRVTQYYSEHVAPVTIKPPL